MAHAMPRFSPWFSRRPRTVFFHHLHARTLQGQISVFLASLLREIEKAYPVIYRNWPFVTESAASETDLRDLGIDPQRITRIPPGVDSALFRISKKAPEPQLVYFGGLRPYKRPGRAIYVMRLLSRKGLRQHLVMVGEGPELSSLKTLVAKMGVKDDVSFVGKLDREKLARVVAESWVNIHCSVAEGWCFSATEASSAGTLTVGYAVVGLSEVVKNGQNDILVKDGDVPALAEAIERVLESPEDWTKRCRSRVEEYSWDRTTDLWELRLDAVSQQGL
jgi:glycosyltransferase involved in cell wall biosynthesis